MKRRQIGNKGSGRVPEIKMELPPVLILVRRKTGVFPPGFVGADPLWVEAGIGWQWHRGIRADHSF